MKAIWYFVYSGLGRKERSKRWWQYTREVCTAGKMIVWLKMQDWRSKHTFHTERDLTRDVSQPFAFCPSDFHLQNEDNGWDIFWGTTRSVLGSENLNTAIHLFAGFFFSPDTKSRGYKNCKGRWNLLLQKCPSGSAVCGLSHVYRTLSGPHTKMLIIIRSL